MRTRSIAITASLLLALRWLHATPAEEPGLLVDARMPLSVMVALVDGTLSATVNALDVLSLTSEVQSGNWERMRPLLARLEERMPPGDVLYLQPDGTYYTVKRGRVPFNARDRAYFRTAMSGKVSVGDLILGRSTGRKDTIVAVPVQRGNAVTGVLAATLYLEPMSDAVKDALRLPEDMLFFILSPEGETALHSRTERVLQLPAQMGSPSLKRATEEILARREGTATYEFEGRERRVVYQASPLTGWRFVLGVVR